MIYSNNVFYIEFLQTSDALYLNKLLVSNTDRFKYYLPKTLAENRTLESTKSYISKKKIAMQSKLEFILTIKDKSSKTIVGLIILKDIDWDKKQGEFAYCMGKQFEGKGWMGDAIKASSNYAFEDLNLETLQIIAHKNNIASIKVAEKCCFIWKKTLKNEFTPIGESPLNMELYELTKNNAMKDKFYKYIQHLQDSITSKLELVDGQAKFKEDLWMRPEGGGGRTRVIENGAIFEKGGVNISGVHGVLPETMQHYFGVKDANFFACGLSLVLHPKNPMVPTVHANWRYFEMYDQTGDLVDSWFGGGQDLTPYYLFEEDAIHFHHTCKTACDKHDFKFYSDYKKKCDSYFWNSHRNEARGIGGLFFDYCKPTETMTMENWYNFVTEVGNSFLESYVPIVEKRKYLNYSKEQRNWQEIRRGRYVEFNLVHDKGTLFGLKTNGRIESILMSLPPHVQWVYDHHPEIGSEEEKLIKVLQNPIDWINE